MADDGMRGRHSPFGRELASMSTHDSDMGSRDGVYLFSD
jgi:hypothetical protein